MGMWRMQTRRAAMAVHATTTVAPENGRNPLQDGDTSIYVPTFDDP